MLSSYTEILLNTPLFHNITAQQLPALISCLHAETREYKKGEYIFMEGDAATYFGIVLEGIAQVAQEHFDGSRTIITDVFAGDLFCETFACAKINSFPVSVIAATNITTMLIDYSRIPTICSIACDFHSVLLSNMIQIFAQKNLLLASKVRHMSQKTIREKLLSYLNEQALLNNTQSFTIPFNRQELADYLCVDRSALSAELSRMQADTLLAYDKNHFTLLTSTIV